MLSYHAFAAFFSLSLFASAVSFRCHMMIADFAAAAMPCCPLFRLLLRDCRFSAACCCRRHVFCLSRCQDACRAIISCCGLMPPAAITPLIFSHMPLDAAFFYALLLMMLRCLRCLRFSHFSAVHFLHSSIFVSFHSFACSPPARFALFFYAATLICFFAISHAIFAAMLLLPLRLLSPRLRALLFYADVALHMPCQAMLLTLLLMPAIYIPATYTTVYDARRRRLLVRMSNSIQHH